MSENDCDWKLIINKKQNDCPILIVCNEKNIGYNYKPLSFLLIFAVDNSIIEDNQIAL